MTTGQRWRLLYWRILETVWPSRYGVGFDAYGAHDNVPNWSAVLNRYSKDGTMTAIRAMADESWR